MPVPVAPQLIDCSADALQVCDGLPEPSGNHMLDIAADDAEIIGRYVICQQAHQALIACHNLRQAALEEPQVEPE